MIRDALAQSCDGSTGTAVVTDQNVRARPLHYPPPCLPVGMGKGQRTENPHSTQTEVMARARAGVECQNA